MGPVHNKAWQQLDKIEQNVNLKNSLIFFKQLTSK